MSSLSYALLINHVPASAALLDAIRVVEVEQHLEAASIFRIHIGLGRDQHGEYNFLDGNLFRPLTPVTISVSLGSRLSRTLIHGYVTAIHAGLDDASAMEVIGVDASAALMNTEEKIRTWPNMADSDIAAMILQEHGLAPVTTPTQPFRMEEDVMVIQRETDMRFLRRLAERNGFVCRIESDPTTGAPVGYFGPLRTEADAQGVLSVNFGVDSNVDRFRIHYDMLRPARATAWGLDVQDGGEVAAESVRGPSAAMGAESTLDALPPGSHVLLSQTGLSSEQELQTYAQAVADRLSWAVRAEGTADPVELGAFLEAGKPVLVRGAGSRFSGAYLVDRVLHEWSRDRYAMRFSLRRNATGLRGTEVFR